jgi:agmatinase
MAQFGQGPLLRRHPERGEGAAFRLWNHFELTHPAHFDSERAQSILVLLYMTQSADLPFIFGGLEPSLSAFDTARVLIWPVPFEKTVSYGQGTREGPAAIIDASRNMELYDEEIGGEPASIGIHTLPAIHADREPEEMMPALEREVRTLLETGKFVCMLGGEHSITPPVVRAFHQKFPRLSVLQIDAHADLRDQYDGTPHSHASAMRRVVEVCPAVQVGIRSLSIEEARAIPSLPTRVFYAKDICDRTGPSQAGRAEAGRGVAFDNWVDDAVDALSEDVYLTIDIDGLDPSLVPSTGTPEPGGLSWYQALALIRTLAAKRNVVGMDLVEVAGGSDRVTSFVAAKLIYKTLGYIFRSQIPSL